MRFLLLISLICLLPKQAWGRAPELIAKDGEVQVLPSFFADGSMPLQGSWAYFHKVILSPDSDCLPQGAESLPALLYWKKDQLDQHPERKGTSSFCLIIDNPHRIGLSLWWPDRNEVDIYANGSLAFGRGQLQSGKGLTHPIGRQSGLMRLPETSTIVLLVHADNSFMRWRDSIEPIRIGPTNTMQDEQESMLIFQTIVVSALACMGLYLFILFLINRNFTESLALALFCFGMSLRQATLNSHGIASVIAPYSLGHHTYSFHFVSYYVASSCFYHFLRLSYTQAIKRWTLHMCWVVCGALSLLTFLFDQAVYLFCLRTFNIMAIILMIYSIKVVIENYWMRKYESLILTLGVVVMIIAGILDMSSSFGRDRNFDTFDLALLFFVVITSILVSIRYFEAFSRLYFFSGELAKIVPLHVVERLQEGLKLESCMPVGEREGIVLVFDVVGSSAIKHPGFRIALETCMARFYQAINENYDPELLTAEGYRLKEMGDGMICAIGFPYAITPGQSLDEAAVQLSEKLYRIFNEVMHEAKLDQPVYCGMGLARGMLEGFFPRTGQKQYDLRGRPLILATRYESMRKVLDERYGRKGSVLFITDTIYQGLSPTLQQTFEFWDASLPGQQIRDDESAPRAWFKVMSTKNYHEDLSDPTQAKRQRAY